MFMINSNQNNYLRSILVQIIFINAVFYKLNPTIGSVLLRPLLLNKILFNLSLIISNII